MGCCFQSLKIGIIILILVNIGTGYTKFYQLLADIVDKVGEIDDLRTFDDLVWIPFLIVQVSSTLFQFIQLYCLLRELCENNFMYKHCFKCCFILTVLIYLLSVLPKSVLTIIYYNYSSSADDWWKSVASFFDSLLSGVTALGFQVILFMPVILRTFRSAGVYRRKVGPTGTKSDVVDDDLDIEKDNADKSKCCFLICCTSSRQKENQTDNEMKKEKSNAAIKKMTKTVKHTAKRGIAIKSSLEAKKKKLEKKVINIKVKQMNKIEQNVEDRKMRIKSKFTNHSDGDKKFKNDVDGDDAGDDDSTQKGSEKKNALMVCLTTCKSKTCICLANRTRCFIITMALANFHLLVYVVEVVFIFCFVC